MSNQNTLNTTVIVIAIVGLIVGAGGGYLVSNNSAQKQINALNDEIADLNSNISTLETQLTENQEEISTLEEDILNLENQNSAQADTIEDLESELDLKEDTIASLEAQIESLSEITEVREGYVQYSLYGFSFEYPNDMITSLSGALESSATQNSGIFTASRDNGETYTVTWIHSMIELDVEDAIMGGYEAISNFVTSRSGLKTLQHLGHTVSYEEYVLEDVTGSYSMIIGGFYCPESDKLYNINYIDQTEDTEQVWKEFLDSFICHIS